MVKSQRFTIQILSIHGITKGQAPRQRIMK